MQPFVADQCCQFLNCLPKKILFFGIRRSDRTWWSLLAEVSWGVAEDFKDIRLYFGETPEVKGLPPRCFGFMFRGGFIDRIYWWASRGFWFDFWRLRLTHLGLCGNWLVDTNERGSVQNSMKDFPAFGWGKMSERSSRSKIEMVCRLLVKTCIKMLEQ